MAVTRLRRLAQGAAGRRAHHIDPERTQEYGCEDELAEETGCHAFGSAAIRAVVLPHDHVPRVVVRHVRSAVPAHSLAQFTIREQQVNALREFLAIGIEESRVAAPAMIDQHVRVCVAHHRLADSHSLEREERQALKRGWHDDDGRGVEREKAIGFRQQPGILNPRNVRQRHQLRAHEHERGRSILVFVGRKKFEQLVAPFAWIYPAAVEQEGSSRRAVSSRLRRGRAASEKIDAASNRFLSDRPDVERPLEKGLFDLGVIGDRPWPLKHLFVDIEMDRRLVMRGRDEDAALGGNVEAEHRRRVEVREENDRIVRAASASQGNRSAPGTTGLVAPATTAHRRAYAGCGRSTRSTC